MRSFDLIGDGDRPGICRSVTIDGQAADLTEVQELLRVHRLAGDETLAEAILADVSDLKAIAESERAVTNLHRGQAGGVLELFDDLLEAAAPETISNALKALKEAEEERDKLKKRVAKISKRHEKLKEFAQRRVELSSLLEKHDDPEAGAGQLEDQLDDLRKQQELLSAERDSLNLDVGRNKQTLKEIDKAENDLAVARQERGKLEPKVTELVARLGLVSLPAGPKEWRFLLRKKRLKTCCPPHAKHKLRSTVPPKSFHWGIVYSACSMTPK